MSELCGSGGVELTATHGVTVQRFVLNSLLTNGFVVRDNDTGALAIVDPGDRIDDLTRAAEEWGGDVRWILVTHCHPDHCAGVSRMVARVGGEVVGSVIAYGWVVAGDSPASPKRSLSSAGSVVGLWSTIIALRTNPRMLLPSDVVSSRPVRSWRRLIASMNVGFRPVAALR